MRISLLKYLVLYIILNTLYIILPQSVHASYVLPYPSYMPGNKMYQISRIFDRINNVWNFGSIAQAKYHLKLSDKYLVEAKTLFEYQQYLLAQDALNRSNSEFILIPIYISRAFQEGKDVRNIKDIVLSAAQKHGEVLTRIDESVPKSFLWIPEKSASTELDLQNLIHNSVDSRNQVASQLEK